MVLLVQKSVEWRMGDHRIVSVEQNRLPELVIGFKRDIYKQVVAAFRHLALENPQNQESGAGDEAGGWNP